jgi:hypothetical protein
MLEPLLHENRSVLMDEELITFFLKDIAKTINGLPFTSTLKPSYFRCLMELTKQNNKVLKLNQTMIINEITHRDYSNIVPDYGDDVVVFGKDVRELESMIQNGSPTAVQVPPKLDYFNGFVGLMGMICEDKNNATESKA